MKTTIKKIIMLVLAALPLTLNLRAGEPEMGIKWQWNSTSGGSWDDVNWSYGEESGLAYKNITTALSGVFTGSVWKDGGGVWYLQTDEPVQVGQIIYGSNDYFHFNRTTISGTTDTPGVYKLNLANAKSDGVTLTDLKSRSGINATFYSVSGTVTVDGAKYMNALLINGMGNNLVLTSAAAGSGTLWVNNDRDDREGKIHMNGSGYAELNNLYITNLEPDAPATNKVRMKISNEGSGTLAFNNVTFMGGAGVRLSSDNIGRVITFRDVTFNAPGSDWMRIDVGTFYFYGSNVKTHDGDLQIGEGGSIVNIEAGGMLKQQGNAPINIGRNASPVEVYVKGLLEASDVNGTTGNNHDIVIGQNGSGAVWMKLSGTGQTHSQRVRVANAENSNAVLMVTDTGAVRMEDQFFAGAGKNSYGRIWLQDSGTISARRQAQIAGGEGSLVEIDIVDHGQMLLNTYDYDSQLGITGTAIITVKDSGYFSARETKLGVNASGRGELYVMNSGSVDVNGLLHVGQSGAGVLSISDNARVMTNNNLNIGGAASASGKVSVSGNATLLAEDIKVGAGGKADLTVSDQAYVFSNGGKFLYINQANDVNGSSGIVTVSGGTLSTGGIDFGSNNASVGTGTAIFNLTGGKLVFRSYFGFHTGNYDNWGQADYTHTASDTQINLGGGVIESWDNWESGMRMNLSGINGNVKFASSDTNGNLKSVTLKGALSGAGGLEVEKGTLIISGTAGGTTVHTYAGQTIIDSGATLRLDGVAELTISLLALEDNGWSAFAGDGTLTLNGKLNLTGFDTVSGDSWRLFDTSLLSGLTISDKSAFLKDFTWDGANTWTYDNDNLFVFNLTTGLLTIPEPSAWALMLTGAALLAVLRRKPMAK